MTDPIQPIDPQHQGQQGYADDDLLGGDDIFTPIPESITDEDDIPYGDVLEKKYQFDQIPEVQEAPVPTAPIRKEVRPTETVQSTEQDIPVPQTPMENPLDGKLQTDVQKKFGDLFFTVKKIYAAKDTLGINEESFDIIGANNDKIYISYRFLLDETSEPIIFITKIEQNKDTEEETTNELKFSFNEENVSLEVMVNDSLIFDEIKDFTEDPKKKMQVVDKINKFIFLTSEELRKLEKEVKEKIEERMQFKKLQEIFRNF